MKHTATVRLHHIENTCEAALGKEVITDSLMDPMKTSTNSWKFSSTEKAGCPAKDSFCTIKNTSLDSSLRKTGSVTIKKQPSCRVLLPPPELALPHEDHTETVETNCSPELSRMVFQRDTRHTQTFKPASTLSSLSETSVHYLNDQSAINVVGQSAHQLSTSKGALCCSHTQDHQEVGVSSQGVQLQTEMMQNGSPSASQRLESLRRQQTDDKLEKLKERIRRQREHLEEAADKKESLSSLGKPVDSDRSYVQYSSTVPSAHVRKVITAPPAPVYKGFSTSETKIHAPDTRINQEEEFIALRRDIYRDLTRQLTGDITRPKARCRERLKGKKPVRSVRKVHKTACISDSDLKPTSITTSKWREGQKLVKMILGSQQSQHKSSPKSGDRVTRTGSLEHPPSNALSNNQNQGKKTEDGKTTTVQLSANIQGILDSLELDTPPGKQTEKFPKRHITPREMAKKYNWTGVSHTAGPTKPCSAEAEKPELAKRKRHYDSAEVREYISRQQVERRKRQTEERRRQQEEAERRNQRLQELYRKQKEGFSKPVAATTTTAASDVGSHRYLQDTYTNLLPEQIQVEAEVLLSPSTSTHKQRPLYQPSNESDKENKHQNRPQSASSSDLSVSENQPLALRNVMGLPARSSWVQHDVLCSSPRGGVAVPLESSLIQTYPQWVGTEGKHCAPSATCLHPTASCSSSTNMTNRMSRLEVLKSTATSLSNRIENEAQKLLLTCKESQMSVSEVDTASLNQWARVDSASIGIVTKLEHPAKNIQKLHCTSLTTYDATLPGVGSLYAFREAQGSRAADAAKDTVATSYFADSLSTKKRENKTGQDGEQIMVQYSQYGSNVTTIGERAKFSQPYLPVAVPDIDSSPLHQTPVFSSGREKCRLASTVSQDLDASTAAWKELTKGSPYSVINIFTKNLPSSSKGQSYEALSKGRSQRSSPASYTGHAEGPHENNLSLTSHSSGQPVGRHPNRCCNNSSSATSKQGSSPQNDLKSPKSGIQSVSPIHSPGTTSCSAANSVDIEGNLDDTLVNDQRDDWSEAKVPESLGSLQECLKGSFAHSSHKDLKTDSTSGAPSVNSMHSLLVDLPQQRAVVCTPSASAGSNPPAASKGIPPPVSGHSVVESFYPNVAHPSTSDVPLPAQEGHASPFLSNYGTEPVVKTGGELQSAPSALQQRMTAELMYLDSIEESIRQLGDVERVRGVSLAQQEVLSLAHVLKSQQQAHEQVLQRLKVKSEQEAFESHMQLEHLHQREKQVFLSKSGGHSASGDPLSSPLSSFEQRNSGGVRNTTDRSPGLEEAYLAAEHSTPSNSMPSLQDDKDSISVATEYSLKFDESMTEDEIEERSFRSLLPSESHRRGTLEKKQSRHEESEEEPAHDPAISLDASKMLQQDSSIPFSSGQNSFSRFTMEMVRQYMKEEEVRAQHQSSLLQLRQRALKEKTRAELAWLEHLKRRLRDKGEDDKMPPIRKKQRVLLLKLQQEQAEIKRLQEANKAARKERQLLLKQQEEIERMRTTTLKLRERLKTACHLDSPSFQTEEPALSQMTVAEANYHSTSPLSVSSSETSSIMQRLKKMHSHMDEKFLTKREQQLKQRRSYAEELLQWKQRLDFEEREIRRMERQALAAWDDDVPEVLHRKDAVEQDLLTQPVMYSTDLSSSQKPTEHSESSQNQLSNKHVDASFFQDSEISQRAVSTSGKTISSLSPEINSDQISSVKQTTSEQSSIESRISALKEELRKRKNLVHQLKKEQKKRHKERLRTQEADLLKQLESYNDFIKKTTSELSKGQENTQLTKPERKPGTEKMGKQSTNQRPEASNNLEETEQTDKVSDFQVNSAIKTSYGGTRPELIHKESLSEEDPPTVTTTPVLGSPDKSDCCRDLVSPESHHSYSSLNASSPTQSVSENLVSHQSVEAETLKNEHSHTYPSDDLSDVLLNLVCSAELEDHSKDLTELSHRENGQSDAPKMMLEYDDNDLVRPDVPLNLPELQLKGKPSFSAYGYNDDFESLAESSNVTFGKEITASTRDEQKMSHHQSVTNYSEDEIGEEFTSKSKSVCEIHSEHLLELNIEKAKLLDEEGGEDLNSSESADLLSSNSQVLSTVDKMASFSIGDRVLVRNLQQGILRFQGQTSFSRGFWAGVELDKSEGSNDGTYDGVVYFKCKPAHGIFVSPSDVSHLPGLCNVDANITDDENSLFDDGMRKEPLFNRSNDQLSQQTHLVDSQKTDKLLFTGDKGQLDQTDGSCELQNRQTRLDEDLVSPVLNQADIFFEFSRDQKKWSLISEESKVINLDHATDDQNCHISMERSDLKRQIQEGEYSTSHDSLHNESDLMGTKNYLDGTGDEKFVSHSFDQANFSTVADQLFKNFVAETVQQYQQIQKAKRLKIQDANIQRDGPGYSANTQLPSPDVKMERFPLFDEEQEITSPELNKRQESPVLDASGQQELVKRLAELEFSRELLDALGDEPDWFEEDFGLSSRKEQRQKQSHLWQDDGITGTVGSIPVQQAKTPLRPDLPLQTSATPEKPVMVVPYDVQEMEKLVCAATQEIWDKCRLGMGKPLDVKPQASVNFLGGDTKSDDQATYCKQSYKQAVFDLSWEVINDIFAQDHNSEQPQWIKPQRTRSSYFHVTKSTEDLQTVQSILTEEVLKLFGLKREQNQQTDWQKMLKFGRKKRDRVDHILVQELHEEESQWVNYDEDELYVKMQLADGIFDALLKDTEDVLIQIQERRSIRTMSS